MTIDLGFAWLDLPSGETIGIVDVPGHRDFVENMLAGVGGIDAVIFVIAADEGIMPQTREHLAILDLLAIKNGIIALTKSDLIEDPEWLDLVIAEIRDATKNTFLEFSPIIPVSAKTGTGLQDIVFALMGILKNIPSRENHQKPRLSIDRVFSITGFGTVVTGTLNDGVLKVGEEIVILPSGIKGRIRGLQTHKHKLDEVLQGSRAAINISGVDVSEINRGDLVTTGSSYKPSFRLDAHVTILPISSRALKHNEYVKIFHLAAERIARIRILGQDKILPGEEGFVQLEFEDALVADRNDRFIMRIPSPGETIGGGIILQIEVPHRHKRFLADVLQNLKAIHAGKEEDRLVDSIQRNLVSSVSKMKQELNISEEKLNVYLSELLEAGEIIGLPEYTIPNQPAYLITKKNWQNITQKVDDIFRNFHEKYPLRSGFSREEFKNKLKLENKDFNILFEAMEKRKVISVNGVVVFSPSHFVTFSPQQLKKIQVLNAEIDLSPFTPPAGKVMLEILGEELLNAMIANRDFLRLSADVIFRKSEYELMKNFVEKTITEQGQITVAEFRDHFLTSRKYALAFLEYMDAIGFTVRNGDFRKLAKINKLPE
jgi:selenocysteine-specific elongation factor